MALETTFSRLEERIDDLLTVLGAARARAAELEARVAELETQLAEAQAAAGRAGEVEAEQQRLRERLEKVLGTLDAALSRAESG